MVYSSPYVYVKVFLDPQTFGNFCCLPMIDFWCGSTVVRERKIDDSCLELHYDIGHDLLWPLFPVHLKAMCSATAGIVFSEW